MFRITEVRIIAAASGFRMIMLFQESKELIRYFNENYCEERLQTLAFSALLQSSAERMRKCKEVNYHARLFFAML